MMAAIVIVTVACGCKNLRQTDALQIVKQYCEEATFIETDLALRWQLPETPFSVQEALAKLRTAGSTDHIPYLSLLLLREYEYQIEQFGGGFTLHSGLSVPILNELTRLLEARGCKFSGDPTSSEYAAAILCDETIFHNYAKGIEISQKLKERTDLQGQR